MSPAAFSGVAAAPERAVPFAAARVLFSASLLDVVPQFHEILVVECGVFPPRGISQDDEIAVDARGQRFDQGGAVLRSGLVRAIHGVGHDELQVDVVTRNGACGIALVGRERVILALPVVRCRPAGAHVVQQAVTHPGNAAAILEIALGPLERDVRLTVFLQSDLLLCARHVALEESARRDTRRRALPRRRRPPGTESHSSSRCSFSSSLHSGPPAVTTITARGGVRREPSGCVSEADVFSLARNRAGPRITENSGSTEIPASASPP